MFDDDHTPRCSECEKEIGHKRRGAITCSAYCRIRRSRRLKGNQE